MYHQIDWDNLGYPGLVTCGPELIGTGATPTGRTYRPDLRPVLGENQPSLPRPQTWSVLTLVQAWASVTVGWPGP